MKQENRINKEIDKKIENSLKRLKTYKKSIQAYWLLQESLYLQAKSLFVNTEDEFIFDYLFNSSSELDGETEYDKLIMQKIIKNLKIV